MAEKAPGDDFKGSKSSGWHKKLPETNLVAQKAADIHLMAETARGDSVQWEKKIPERTGKQ